MTLIFAQKSPYLCVTETKVLFEKLALIESESWLFQKNRVRVGQKMLSQSRVDAESSLAPITSETFWVWASPSLKKSSPI